MQLIKSAIVFASLLTAASAVAVDVCKCSIWHIQFQMADLTEAAADVDAKMKRDFDMEARDLDSLHCHPNGCKCEVGTKQGLYCGLCGEVIDAGSNGTWSDLFRCQENGECCTYGPHDDCDISNTTTSCPW
jgi:hypothetical protein